MHIDIDEYAHLDSVIHRWDPRVRIFSFLVLVFSISWLKHLSSALLALAAAFLVLLLSRIPLRYILRKSLYPLVLLIPLFVTLPLSAGGSKIVLYGVSVYSQGIVLALLIGIKAIAIIVLFTVMMSSAPFAVTGAAMRGLHVPTKLVDIILFSYRYFFVYLEDLRKMRTALRLRGFINRTGLNAFKTYSRVAGSMIIRSFEHSERIYSSMVLRGYTGNVSTLHEFKVELSDIMKAFVFCLIGLSLVLAELYAVEIMCVFLHFGPAVV